MNVVCGSGKHSQFVLRWMSDDLFSAVTCYKDVRTIVVASLVHEWRRRTSNYIEGNQSTNYIGHSPS
jgi:hypothetical protein